MERIPAETIEIMQENILGKRIRVEISGQKWEGICTFFGYNRFLPSWGLQVTIGRLPLTNLELSQITVLGLKDHQN